jgi:ankyrin repeat protein
MFQLQHNGQPKRINRQSYQIMTEEIEGLEKYQLHFHIFNNNVENLETAIQKQSKRTAGSQNPTEIFSVLFRGQTPLTLAVCLNRIECVKLLLLHGAKCLEQNALGWTAWHEAISYGNRDMIKV